MTGDPASLKKKGGEFGLTCSLCPCVRGRERQATCPCRYLERGFEVKEARWVEPGAGKLIEREPISLLNRVHRDVMSKEVGR